MRLTKLPHACVRFEQDEAVLVPEGHASLDEPCGVDDERRLPERIPRLDQTGQTFESHYLATPPTS